MKAELYAHAGIREHWVVDIRVADAPTLIVHREPAEGLYSSIARFNHTDEAKVLDGRSLSLQDSM